MLEPDNPLSVLAGVPQIVEASDSKTAAKQLGHSREGITERHYIASPE
ncbi:hypothetical protein F5X71_07755 [Nocardia brasiliensis]|uniref:Uncharacterized protein n=1 Tax=Nocardia brasiliensis TaxID=37326 RepID=A0A6G9XMT0_NOCBR|nr:hypothetical protein [Nocardia brasiliensis]QIS02225.1 hypothetical protein F5X71_07755 [Nocardia brasiliensis]